MRTANKYLSGKLAKKLDHPTCFESFISELGSLQILNKCLRQMSFRLLPILQTKRYTHKFFLIKLYIIVFSHQQTERY